MLISQLRLKHGLLLAIGFVGQIVDWVISFDILLIIHFVASNFRLRLLHYLLLDHLLLSILYGDVILHLTIKSIDLIYKFIFIWRVAPNTISQLLRRLRSEIVLLFITIFYLQNRYNIYRLRLLPLLHLLRSLTATAWSLFLLLLPWVPWRKFLTFIYLQSLKLIQVWLTESFFNIFRHTKFIILKPHCF